MSSVEISKSSPNFLTVELKCPKCHYEYTDNIEISESQIKIIDVGCLKCGHKWTYRGMLKSRIRCPKCRSSRNEVNREIFGLFKREDIESKGSIYRG